MGVVLALASALVFGLGDYSGGIATKRSPAQLVTLFGQIAGLVAMLPFAFLVDSTGFTLRTAITGGLAGLAGGIGLMLLYHGLSVGMMSIVSPISAVVGATVPVIAGLLLGERPSAAALVGIGCAIAAIGLVSLTGGFARLDVAPVLYGLGAGAGFGLFFVSISRADNDAGLWPLVAAKPASIAIALIVSAVFRLRVSPRGLPIGIVVLSGVADMMANLLFLLASQRGLLAISAAIGSLYPASTVLLARIFQKERLTRVQGIGLALAAAALMLVSIS